MTAYNSKKINNQNQVGHWGNIVKAKMNIIEKFAGKKILDIGCSTGSHVFYLNKHNYDAYGCDISRDEQWEKDPKRFKTGNIYNLPYDNQSFDTAIALEIFEHLENPQRALKEISRVIKKNVIISVPNCELPLVFSESGLAFYHHIDKTHINRFIKEDIEKLLTNQGFIIDTFNYISPIRPEALFFYTWF